MAKIINVGIALIVTALAGCAAAVPGYVQKTPPPPAIASYSAVTVRGQSEVVTNQYNALYSAYNTPTLTSYYPASVGIDAGASFGPGTERYNPTSYYGGY